MELPAVLILCMMSSTGGLSDNRDQINRLDFGGEPLLFRRQGSANGFESAKIEATELDRKMLLSKLNENGKDRDQVRNVMKFELVDADYDYRIVFTTDQGATLARGSSMNSVFIRFNGFVGGSRPKIFHERNCSHPKDGNLNDTPVPCIK
ncbi:MAG TPA: hypothetical protein VN946_03900 [Terriglobales bacterium]|jgi:hypothetical protein|nr:hypothetical protein [Terriglobales bacterium]